MQANDAIGEICSPPFHCFLFEEGCFWGGGGDLISFVLKLWFKLAYENLLSYISFSINIFLSSLCFLYMCARMCVCLR